MENITSNLSKTLRRTTIVVAIVAAGIIAAPAVHAKPKPKVMTTPEGTKVTLESPQSLPELARQNGEAMLLHETGDGRTFLYVEQDHGARLAIFDVTDPSNIRAQGAVRLTAPGSFDFIAAAGEHAETVRFRESHTEALLDLHKANAPAIKAPHAVNVQMAEGRVDATGDDEQTTAHEAVAVIANLQEAARAFEVEGVRAQLTNKDTGTTFLMTADGLYVVRRTMLEQEYAAHQDQLSNPG